VTAAPREVCADAVRCPRLGECREAADRARWGDSGYERMQAWVREVVDDAPPPLSAEQADRLRGLFARPPGPRPPLPCPLTAARGAR
jgi:hypothetical protein